MVPPMAMQALCNASMSLNVCNDVQEQSLVDIEMPGQYMNGDEPAPDSIVFLESISSNVHVSLAVSHHAGHGNQHWQQNLLHAVCVSPSFKLNGLLLCTSCLNMTQNDMPCCKAIPAYGSSSG